MRSDWIKHTEESNDNEKKEIAWPEHINTDPKTLEAFFTLADESINNDAPQESPERLALRSIHALEYAALYPTRN